MLPLPHSRGAAAAGAVRGAAPDVPRVWQGARGCGVPAVLTPAPVCRLRAAAGLLHHLRQHSAGHPAAHHRLTRTTLGRLRNGLEGLVIREWSTAACTQPLPPTTHRQCSPPLPLSHSSPPPVMPSSPFAILPSSQHSSASLHATFEHLTYPCSHTQHILVHDHRNKHSLSTAL